MKVYENSNYAKLIFFYLLVHFITAALQPTEELAMRAAKLKQVVEV